MSWNKLRSTFFFRVLRTYVEFFYCSIYFTNERSEVLCIFDFSHRYRQFISSQVSLEAHFIHGVNLIGIGSMNLYSL